MSDAGPIKILLIEDDKNDAELIQLALRKANIQERVHVIRDGQEAIEFIFCKGKYADRLIIEDEPKVIFLDLKLPKIDGLEVLKCIKSDPRTKAIPTVVLTSSKEQHDKVLSYQFGSNSYIMKPGDLDEFSTAVQKLGLYWMVSNSNL
jgi:CheY-like chemotaxis protein